MVVLTAKENTPPSPQPASQSKAVKKAGSSEFLPPATARDVPLARYCTRIHGRYYDLRTFRHPGGQQALRCGLGRDSTDLFRLYHPHAGRALARVAAREISVADAELCGLAAQLDQRSPRLTFKWEGVSRASQWELAEGSFGREAMDIAMDFLKKEQLRTGAKRAMDCRLATPRRIAEVSVFGLLFFLSAWALALGKWWALLAAPFWGWIFSVNFWHDCLHFAWGGPRTNRWLPLLFPWFSSPTMWLHQHVIGHHTYPDVPTQDPDMYHAPRFLRVTPALPWRKRHERGISMLPILYSWGVFTLLFVIDMRALITNVYNRALMLYHLDRTEYVAHILGRLVTLATILFPWWGWAWGAEEPWVSGLMLRAVFATVPMIVYSLLFMLNTQINHLNEQNTGMIVDVDKCVDDKLPAKDAFVHQVETATNWASDHYWAFIFSGGLNLQTEHHVWPWMNHEHLYKLRPQLRALCKKHKIKYSQYDTLWEAVVGHVRHLDFLAKYLDKDDQRYGQESAYAGPAAAASPSSAGGVKPKTE